MEKDKLTRVPYFFSIIAIILDLVCGLNYTFIQEWDNMMGLVEQLKNVATKASKRELIGISAEDATEKEKNEKKDDIFNSVKFFSSQRKAYRT